MTDSFKEQNFNNRNQVLDNIRKLFKAFEEDLLPKPEQHEVHPNLELGSRENYLYFTFPCAINYQRNSPAMWASALATYQDEATCFIFEPALVAKASFDEVQFAMRKYSLALKTNKDPQAWQRLATTFAEQYNSDPRNLIAEAEYSIARLMQIIQKEKKQHFPYIGGLKLSNYWAFILSRFTDLEFVDPFELSIIPDVHIIRASKLLGIVDESAKAKDVDAAWRPLLKEVGIPAYKMHHALWLWGRSGFQFELTGVPPQMNHCRENYFRKKEFKITSHH